MLTIHLSVVSELNLDKNTLVKQVTEYKFNDIYLQKFWKIRVIKCKLISYIRIIYVSRCEIDIIKSKNSKTNTLIKCTIYILDY